MPQQSFCAVIGKIFGTCQIYYLRENAGISEKLRIFAGIYGQSKGRKKTGDTNGASKENPFMKTKNTISTNRKTQIQKHVERGYALHLQIAGLSEEFKSIKELLKAEALTRPQERVPLANGSEGDQWIATADRCECRIVFPGKKLKTDFDPAHAEFAAIKSLAGTHFGSLFRRVTHFQPAEKDKFRAEVTRLLSPLEATHLLELCSAPSEPKAVWKERSAPTGKKKAAR
jgi:hypothetical protein